MSWFKDAQDWKRAKEKAQKEQEDAQNAINRGIDPTGTINRKQLPDEERKEGTAEVGDKRDRDGDWVDVETDGTGNIVRKPTWDVDFPSESSPDISDLIPEL